MGAIRNSVQAFSAGGMFLPGGSVIFGNENQRPDPDNPGTLKQVFTDVGLTTPAQNPQPLDSDAKFEQGGSTGTLYGSGVYSYVVLDASGVERTYVPSFTVISALTAQDAAEAAEAAQSAAEAAQVAAEDAAESITVPVGASITIAIDTIADLRALEPLFDGQQIELLGHTVAGIGGGIFYADYSDTTSADNNGTVIVTTGGRRWKRKLNGFVTPEMFGAIAGANSTTSCQSAINESSSTGLPVIAGMLTYNVSGLTLPSRCTVIGTSKEVTEFRLIDNSDEDVFRMSSTTAIRPTLKNFRVNGNKANQSSGNGINLQSNISTSNPNSTSRPFIDNVSVRECKENGFNFEAVGGNLFGAPELTNCIALENDGRGFRFRLCGDGYTSRLVSGGNKQEGVLLDNCANMKMFAGKTFFNGEDGNGRGWSSTGGLRNLFYGCEAQEDYQQGFSFFQEQDSQLFLYADANGREASPGTGLRMANCSRIIATLSSTSFQVPTWQGVAIELNANTDIDIRLSNNSSVVSTEFNIVGTANNNITVSDGLSRKTLVSPSTSFIEVGEEEIGSWTPQLDFSTSGDLSVSYTTQNGAYTKKGNEVTLTFDIEATLAHTTASGSLFIRGIPFSVQSGGVEASGQIQVEGIGAGLSSVIGIGSFANPGADVLSLRASRLGASMITIDASSAPTGSVKLTGTITYLANT